jgi:hypothetical protein
MVMENNEFEEKFSSLYDFYEITEPKKVHCFIKKHENILELLDESKHYLKETFPQGEFELEVYCDLSGEEAHSLLVNIHVDDETFNNGFMFKIHHVNMKILPLQKKLNILSEFGLMPGVRNQCKE